MAINGRRALNVDYCVSFTGNAGPEAMEGKPVGEIYIGIASIDGIDVYGYQLEGSREDIQSEGVKNALELLKQKIIEKN